MNPGTYHLYVSCSGSKTLSRFTLDAESGALESAPGIEIAAEPGAIATNADGSRMYVSLRRSRSFQSFSVDRRTGELMTLNHVHVGRGGPYLTLDRSGRYMFAVYRGAGAVCVYRLEADGSIGEEHQWVDTAKLPHCIQVDAGNRRVYVPHTMPTNAIFQFRFDAGSGTLTPNDPPLVRPETPEGPRHIIFHPSRPFLYSVNESGCTVSTFRLDPANGVLTPLQVLSTLPPGYNGGGKTADIRMTPDGKHLYASNRGHDSLAIFAAGEDGMLQALGHEPTEPKPRFFDIDPTGRNVLALGRQSNHLALYRIRPDGSLECRSRHPVGPRPLWIQFVEKCTDKE